MYSLSGQEPLGINMATVHQVAAKNRLNKRSHTNFLFRDAMKWGKCVEVDKQIFITRPGAAFKLIATPQSV